MRANPSKPAGAVESDESVVGWRRLLEQLRKRLPGGLEGAGQIINIRWDYFFIILAAYSGSAAATAAIDLACSSVLPVSP